jgi:Dockerin type I domain
MAEPNQQDEDNDLQAPPGLIEVMGGLAKESVFIPPAINEAILGEAGLRFAGVRRRVRRRRTTQWLALAASFVVAVWLAQLSLRSLDAKREARGDLNHDGRVDVLDAFQLARELKQGKPLPKAMDLNGDGKVDEADVQIIAKRAVSLEKGGRS